MMLQVDANFAGHDRGDTIGRPLRSVSNRAVTVMPAGAKRKARPELKLCHARSAPIA